MKKKTLIAHVIYVAICIGISCSLNGIISATIKTPENHLEQEDFTSYQANAKDMTYFDIVSFEYNEDNFETITVKGSAAVNTNNDNSERQISLIFKSEKNCYVSTQVSTHGFPPPEIKQAMGLSYCFDRTVSTLPMKYGEYQLYIYCYENNENYGLVDTGKIFIKNAKGFYDSGKLVDYGFDPQIISDAPIDATVNLNYIISEGEATSVPAKMQSKKLFIEGWTFLEEVDSKEQEVYVAITIGNKTSYLKASQPYRNDVSQAFNNKKYEYSGFFVSLSEEFLGDNQTFSFKVIVKHGDSYHLAPIEYNYDIATKQIKFDDLTKRSPEVQAKDFSQYSTVNKDKVYYDIKTVHSDEKAPNLLTIEGTAGLDTEMDNSARELSLIFKSQQDCYATQATVGSGAPPVDLRKPMGYSYQFMHTMDTASMRDGEYTLFVFCHENEENSGLVDTGMVFLKDETGLRYTEKILFSGLDINAAKQANVGAYVYIDSITPENEGAGPIKVDGWAFVDGVEAKKQETYVEITTGSKQIYLKASQPYRPDVSTAYQTPLYDYSGCFLLLDPTLFENETSFELRIVVKNNDTYHKGNNYYTYDLQSKQMKGYTLV